MRQHFPKLVLLLLIPLLAVSQDVPFPRGGRGGGRFPQRDEPLNGREEFRRRTPLQPPVKFGEFTFTRLRYGGGGGRRGGWATDYPEADEKDAPPDEG